MRSGEGLVELIKLRVSPVTLRHPIPETPAPEISSRLFPLKSSGFASDYQLTLKWQWGQSLSKTNFWPFLNKQKQVFTFV